MVKEGLISVIVPVNDSSKFLKESLKSLRLQTYENLEFICINDSSNEELLEILNVYKELDDRFVIVNKEKGSKFSALNAGLKLAKGEYASFVNSGTRVSLSLYKNFADIENKTDIFMFNAVKQDDSKTQIFPQYLFNPNEWKNYTADNARYTFNDCINIFHGDMNIYNKIYRIGFLKFLSGEFPKGTGEFEEQYFFFLTMLEANAIIINSNPMYYYRNSPCSISNKTSDIFLVTDKIESLIRKKGLYESYKYALFQHKYRQYATEFLKTDEPLRAEFYEEMRRRLNLYKNENMNSQICAKLTHYGIYKNIFNLDAEAFFAKYYGKI